MSSLAMALLLRLSQRHGADRTSVSICGVVLTKELSNARHSHNEYEERST